MPTRSSNHERLQYALHACRLLMCTQDQPRPTRTELKAALAAATTAEQKRSSAFGACIALEQAYAKTGDDVSGSVDWPDVDLARAHAQEALGKNEEVRRVSLESCSHELGNSTLS